MPRQSVFVLVRNALISIGPAFFVVGYTIGTGSIVTMASAGSRYGMALLWVLVMACFFSFIMLDLYGRYALVTGEGTLHGIRSHIPGGKYLALFLLAGLVFVEVLALTGIMGILADLIHDWTAMLSGGDGWNRVAVVGGISIIVYFLIVIGKYSLFEKVLIVFVSIMGISFILTFFIVPPDPEAFIRGLIPSLPAGANVPLLVSALVGTTFTAPTFVVRSILMKEKGWGRQQKKHARKDAFWGATLMFLISMTVMAAAAATLFVAGKPVDRVVEMVKLLEPLLGRFAVSVFVSGIIGAALSSVIPIAMLAPLLVSDYRNRPVHYKSLSFRLMGGVAILFGLIVPIFGFRPVYVMLVSQVFQVFILPLVVGIIAYLTNRKDLMKNDIPGAGMNFFVAVIFLFTLFITYQAVLGLIESFHTIF